MVSSKVSVIVCFNICFGLGVNVVVISKVKPVSIDRELPRS